MTDPTISALLGASLSNHFPVKGLSRAAEVRFPKNHLDQGRSGVLGYVRDPVDLITSVSFSAVRNP
jgi:hypothetical protein